MALLDHRRHANSTKHRPIPGMRDPPRERGLRRRPHAGAARQGAPDLAPEAPRRARARAIGRAPRPPRDGARRLAGIAQRQGPRPGCGLGSDDAHARDALEACASPRPARPPSSTLPTRASRPRQREHAARTVRSPCGYCTRRRHRRPWHHQERRLGSQRLHA